MPRIIVTTPHPALRAQRVASQLDAVVEPGPGGPATLRVGPDAAPADVQALVRRLQPLRVEVRACASMSGITLDLGDEVVIDGTLNVHVPPAWRRDAFLAALPVLTPAQLVPHRNGPRRASLAGSVVAAALHQPDWVVNDHGGQLTLTGGARVCGQVAPGMAIEVVGDEPALRAFHRNEAALRHAGWRLVASPVDHPAAEAVIWAPAGLHPSVASELAEAAPMLGSAVAAGLRPHAEPILRVLLTAAAPEESARPPHAVIRTDAPEEAEALVAGLRALGIAGVDVVLGLTFTDGFALRHPNALRRTAIVADVERLIDQQVAQLGLTDVHRCNTTRVEALPPPATLEIDLPLRAAREGRLLAEVLGAIDRYAIKVGNMAQPAELQRTLEAALQAASGRRARVGELSSRQDEHRIAVGAAPWEIANTLARAVQAATGVELPIERPWSPTDNDIWISVPPGTRMLRATSSTAPLTPRTAARNADAPFVERGPDAVRIGTVTLPRRPAHPLAPALEAHAHTCIDAPTARLLGHLALSVQLREPVLLEGPTAAGKTSGVLYLAAMLGQPVVRINLSGQTDTGELIGRYAPSPAGWAWQEGVIPAAMRHGWWVVLDELNLAEPAIVERLNPVLERTPALVLTEGDGTRFGPGGLPVAAGFHVFATMNPADGAYGGRNCLSPALRDRFTAQLQCAAPGEADLRDLLMQLVHGYGPDVTVGGAVWTGATGLDAPHAALAHVPQIDAKLAAFARFHGSVEAAASATDAEQRLGGERREGLVVSRRVLLAVLDYLCWNAAQGVSREVWLDAIERYYVARGAGPADRTAILRLAQAAGLDAARMAA